MEEPHKICSKCMKDKPQAEYYKNKKMADGYSSRCKDCVKEAARISEAKRKSTPEGIETERARHREKYHRLGYRERQIKWDDKRPWKSTHAYKNLRRNINNNFKDSDICDIRKCELHHWNYNELENVILMTPSDHKRWHKQIALCTDRLCFVTKDGLIMDTVMKHIEEMCSFLGTTVADNIYKKDGKWKMSTHHTVVNFN